MLRLRYMKTERIVIYLFALWTIFLSMSSCGALAADREEYCQLETFRPRCLPGETVVVTKAVYGRMSVTGRCLQDEDWEEEVLPALKRDPKYLGCYEDVLGLVSARCSGRPDCEIRIPDPEMEKTNPCYKHMDKYLELSYHCITVVQPDRSCQVPVNIEQKFLLPSSLSNSSGSDGIVCGSRERPWSLEAPSGQRINISLLDFSGSRTADHRSTSSSRCEKQFGFIEDKLANRNINICGDDAHRQPTLYVSKSNQVDIVLTSREQRSRKFLISVRAVGCSDLVPPSDAWLKRTDNVATVGCYMTRQTWILTCDHNSRWTGTFGNCTQQFEAVHRKDNVPVSNASQSYVIENNLEEMILVIVTAVSILVCIIIICIGAVWLCRIMRKKKPGGYGYGSNSLLTSVDVRPTAID